MPTRKSVGFCELCGGQFGRAGMTRHLSACKEATSSADAAPAFLVLVAGGRDYWLHLAVPVKSPLSELDRFLRATWLECCGHLSAFEIGGVSYYSDAQSGDRRMAAPIGRVAGVGDKFGYEYDFGSTTALTITILNEWASGAPKGKIELLAQNDEPEIVCDRCTAIATLICGSCEEWLCDDCASADDCGDDCLMPVVNSPRAGVCGYSG